MLTNTKQVFNKEFFLLVSAIKKASDKGLEFLFFKKKNNHYLILQLLRTEGFIVSYQEHPNFLIIRLKSNAQGARNTKAFSILNATQRIGRKNFTVSLQELIKLQRREGMSTYYIINTDYGLVTSFSAIEKGVGGKLLIKIS
jgi:ribosomal protein S8